MHLKDLKDKSPKQLLSQAEELGVEDASSMRVQDLVFAIMKKVAEDDHILYGDGVIEVMQDGFGFLRSSRSNYLASADDIYVSPQQVKKYGLRTGDTVEGEIRAPKENAKHKFQTLFKTPRGWFLSMMQDKKRVIGEISVPAAQEWLDECHFKYETGW